MNIRLDNSNMKREQKIIKGGTRKYEKCNNYSKEHN